MKRFATNISTIVLGGSLTLVLLWWLGSAVVAGETLDDDDHPRPLETDLNSVADERADVDLSPSRKMVNPKEADVGEILTYTIVLFNNGIISATDTVLFDPIPISTVYVPGSAYATSGVFVGTGGLTGTLVHTGTLIYTRTLVYPDGIRWTGTVTSNEAITITFRVTVSESVFIENTVIVTDRYGTSIPLTAWVNANHVYLPLILSRSRARVPMLGMALERYDNESGLEKALELGVHWGRRWRHISWRDVEPNEGEYHWEALADLEDDLSRARASSIEPIIEIQFTPEWAQKVVPYACGPIKEDKFEAFAGFLEQLVTRYGSSSSYDVRYWQLGNELDVAPGEVRPESVIGCWGDPDDPYFGGESYGEMLKVVYPRVKAADPQAQVMLGGLLQECDPYTMMIDDCRNEWRWKSGFFLEGVMRVGGGDYFDVADVHSYAQLWEHPTRMHSYYAWSGDEGGTGLPEKVAFFRQVMEDYGHGDKPVFAGELALKCEEPTEECYDVAAAFVPRAYAEAYGLDLLGGVYYTLISPDSYISRYKGLLLPDFTPRPAFWAYKFMSRQLLGTRYKGSIKAHTGVSGFAFDKDGGRQVQILWSIDGTDQVIDVPTGFVGAYDKYGDLLTPDAGLLTVGWSPIYVELEQGTTSEQAQRANRGLDMMLLPL